MDDEPNYRIGLMTAAERHEHGQRWIAHCRAALHQTTPPTLAEPAAPTVATPHEPDPPTDGGTR